MPKRLRAFSSKFYVAVANVFFIKIQLCRRSLRGDLAVPKVVSAKLSSLR